MSEFEEKLNAILSDPAEMERISRLAAELMGGGATPAEPQSDGAESSMLRRLSGLLGGAGSGNKTALLNALAPYLRPERQERLRRALQLAGMLRMANTALREEGEGRV